DDGLQRLVAHRRSEALRAADGPRPAQPLRPRRARLPLAPDRRSAEAVRPPLRAARTPAADLDRQRHAVRCEQQPVRLDPALGLMAEPRHRPSALAQGHASRQRHRTTRTRAEMLASGATERTIHEAEVEYAVWADERHLVRQLR